MRLLEQLLNGVALGPAIQAVVAEDPHAENELDAQIGSWLAAWVTRGALSRVEVA